MRGIDETATCPRCNQEIIRVTGDTFFHHMSKDGQQFRCNDRDFCCIAAYRVIEQEDLPLEQLDA